MRTGTEFISEISAATIFTSFNFHIFRFSGKGEVDVYRMCMCFIVSTLVTVSGHLATRKFRHQPTRHRETILPPRNHHATNQLAAK